MNQITRKPITTAHACINFCRDFRGNKNTSSVLSKMYSLRTRTSEHLRQSTIEFPCKKRQRELLVKDRDILSEANDCPIAKRTRQSESPRYMQSLTRVKNSKDQRVGESVLGESPTASWAILSSPSAGMPTTRSSARAKGGLSPPQPSLSNKENRAPQRNMVKTPKNKGKVTKSPKKTCEKERAPQLSPLTPAGQTLADKTPAHTPPGQTTVHNSASQTPGCKTPARTPGRGE